MAENDPSIAPIVRPVWLRTGVPLALGAALCGAAYGLRRLAWQCGHDLDVARHYSGCVGGRMLLLLLAMVMLFWFLGTRENVYGPRTAKWLAVGTIMFSCLACTGGYVAWFLGFGIIVPVVVKALLWPGRGRQRAASWPLALEAVVFPSLFVFLWYQCASLGVPFLQGLAARLDERCDPERLLAWAKQVTALSAATDADQRWPKTPLEARIAATVAASTTGPNTLAALAGLSVAPDAGPLPSYLVPAFVTEAFRSEKAKYFHVWVTGKPHPMVAISTGMHSYYFAQIEIDPGKRGVDRVNRQVEWRPGIYLGLLAPPK